MKLSCVLPLSQWGFAVRSRPAPESLKTVSQQSSSPVTAIRIRLDSAYSSHSSEFVVRMPSGQWKCSYCALL
jgi:hypothetical protein